MTPMTPVIGFCTWLALVLIFITTWPVEGFAPNAMRGAAFMLIALVVAVFYNMIDSGSS